MKMNWNDKPKVFLSKDGNTISQLETMVKTNHDLYDKCLLNNEFAYYINQMINKAIHFDYLIKKGIIPKDYLD